MQFFDKMINSNPPSQFVANLICVLVDTQTRAQPIEHLDDLGGPLP